MARYAPLLVLALLLQVGCDDGGSLIASSEPEQLDLTAEQIGNRLIIELQSDKHILVNGTPVRVEDFESFVAITVERGVREADIQTVTRTGAAVLIDVINTLRRRGVKKIYATYFEPLVFEPIVVGGISPLRSR